MDDEVFTVLQELDDLITNPKGVLTAANIAYLHASLHTLLAVYTPPKDPQNTNPGNPVDAIGETRRAPLKRPEEPRWKRIVRGIFG